MLLGLTGAAGLAYGQKAKPLFNGVNLDGWQVHGDGKWHVLDGVLIGNRPKPGPKAFGEWPAAEKLYRKWLNQQAWLYTEAEFEEFDLQLEYWIPEGGNSGVSIRDSSRGDKSYGPGEQITPAHIGYEIQIIDGAEKFPAGSIYSFVAAPNGLHNRERWNTLEISSRKKMIRTRLNGKPAAEFAGAPERPTKGPIGLQLHDQFSLVMFKRIMIKEL